MSSILGCGSTQKAWSGDPCLRMGRTGAVLILLCAPLLGQDLQLGLDRQAPRALQINPPGGFLRLDSAASEALALRFGLDVWHPKDRQALELTVGLRLPSERQLTFVNSAGVSGNVQARLRLDTQLALGALYRFERPFGLPLEAGLGLEARRERLVMKDGGLASAGQLNRAWVRAVLRHRFGAGGHGPFVALEWAWPLTSAPAPSGVDYLLDLDHLGRSPSPGTSATAHAPTYSLTLAVGYRFGGRPPSVSATAHIPSPEPLALLRSPAPPEAPPEIRVPSPVNPLPAPAQPEGIVLDEAALHFALDRAEVPPQGLEVLAAWGARIKALKQPLVLSVSGYTDATGRRDHNVHLSQARAQAVAEVLKAEGLAVDRVEGLGPDHPVASNETPEGRAKNRRVEICIEGVQARGQVSSDPVTEHAEPRKILKKRP